MKYFAILVLACAVACSNDDTPDPTDAADPTQAQNPSDPADTSDPTDPTDETDPSTVDPNPNMGMDTRPVNSTCVAPERPQYQTSVSLVNAFPNLSFTRPLLARQAPGNANRWYVVEQRGRIYYFDNDAGANSKEIFLNIESRVRGYNDAGGGYKEEQGLLGFAFDPNFESNGRIFVNYTGNGLDGTTIVSKFSASLDGTSADSTSEEILMEIDQPYSNHNGGHIEFGGDGYLYIGMGDGGSGGDPLGHGQDLDTLLGTILRIDVSGDTGYGVPASNPFVGTGSAEEIYAYGMRNPWRFHFDRDEGTLWAGDVGQNEYEEIDIVVSGGNYGWNIREGAHCYDSWNCDTEGLIDPVAEYDHSQGYSVTGGYVYRGTLLPGLTGKYLFGDYGSGNIWTLTPDGNGGYERDTLFANTGKTIASFAEDLNGEIYVVSLYTGEVLKFSGNTTEVSNFPSKLSETGCAADGNNSQPSSGMIPYQPVAPFWSDNAEKKRWLAIPDDTSITMDDEGDFIFPIGSVLRKDFYLAGTLGETRLFVRHDDGEWAGYSFAWSAAGDDADLVGPNGQNGNVGEMNWNWPSRAQCMACHSAAAGRTLGLEAQQLDTEYLYPGNRDANQIETLQSIGVLEGDIPAGVAAMPSPFGEADLNQRARAYLHTNCASCHRPGATGGGASDMRYQALDPNLCNVDVQVPIDGFENAKLLTPGNPESSMIVIRGESSEWFKMPPVGRSVVDSQGMNLVREWINSLENCD